MSTETPLVRQQSRGFEPRNQTYWAGVVVCAPLALIVDDVAVREERPVVLIERRHLPSMLFRDDFRRRPAGEMNSLQQARAAYERDFILRKLGENDGNVSRAAQELGLERSHLYRKMKSLGISTRN